MNKENEFGDTEKTASPNAVTDINACFLRFCDGDTNALDEIKTYMEDTPLEVEECLSGKITADPKCQYYIGKLKYYINKETNNIGKSSEWYVKSAKNGFVKAQIKVASYYYDGFYYPKDTTMSLIWAVRALLQNAPESQDAMDNITAIFSEILRGVNSFTSPSETENRQKPDSLICEALWKIQNNESQDGLVLLEKAGKWSAEYKKICKTITGFLYLYGVNVKLAKAKADKYFKAAGIKSL